MAFSLYLLSLVFYVTIVFILISNTYIRFLREKITISIQGENGNHTSHVHSTQYKIRKKENMFVLNKRNTKKDIKTSIGLINFILLISSNYGLDLYLMVGEMGGK
jgi:hypothetical protein